MKLIAKQNRELIMINAQNTQNENEVEKITIQVPEQYEDYNKKIVFITPDGVIWDIIQNNEYLIKKAITKYNQVDFYIWLTKGDVDFRTQTRTLKFNYNTDASEEITEEEIGRVNTVINILDDEIETVQGLESQITTKLGQVDIAIEQVNNLDLDASKSENTTTVTLTNKTGTTKTVQIDDGVSLQFIWQGTSLGIKTEEQEEYTFVNLQGVQGEQGEKGDKGDTPQKGVDYYTNEEKLEMESDVKEDILGEVYTKSETNTLLEEKADVEDIPDVSSFITKDVNNLTNYTLKTNTGSLIDLEINNTTYVVTLKLKNIDGTVISTDTIDLPLESVVVSGRYDNTTKKVILTLENGSEVDFSIADLVAGLQTEITSSNRLASDLIDDTNSGNKFVTTSEKQAWNNKYDKPNAGIPKTDLASNVQTSLDKADSALQQHQDISGKENISNKVTSISAQSTDTQYSSAKCVYNEIKKIQEFINNIETTRGHVYGIRRKITSNSSSAWERLFDSIGKTATATKNGGTVQNDFDNIAPWSEIKSCNYDLTTGKIKAWIGDPDFKFDGSNGDVFTHIPKTYWKIYQANGYDYVLLADYARSGFTEIDGFFVGRYNGAVVDDVLHTYSGLVPTTNKTIGAFRTLANALGDNFSQLDWRYFVLQMLYLVEYADYNSQNKLGNGIQSRKSAKAIVAESSTNRAIIASSSGYYVGQIIRIGTSDSGAQIADARKITAIEDYNSGGVTGYALTFDGEAVNIAVDNYINTMAQITGQCDELAMKSGCLNNDGYHSVIYRGVENLFANIWQFVDGLNIKDYVAYVCKDHSQYADNTFASPYKQLAYTNTSPEGWAKTLGFDVDEPFFRFPTEAGGGSSTYMSDYYYRNSGNRIARVGGFDSGSGDGLWYWNFGGDSSIAGWSIGCRVLIDNQ